MEENNSNRLSSLRLSGGLKSTLSARSSPRGSPSFRRLNSKGTPRREGRGSGFNSQWFRSNRIVLWLLLITLWAYGGFYFQSRWAHGDNKEPIFGGYVDDKPDSHTEVITSKDDPIVEIKTGTNQSNLNNLDVVLAEKDDDDVSSRRSVLSKKKKKGKKSTRASRRKGKTKQPVIEVDEVQEEDIPTKNSTYGMLVGPFGTIEDTILDWSPEKRSGTCDRQGAFARLVWSRKFVLIFHELSMTGAPLAMLELATEFLSCGATVSVVVLSKKGGLMPELTRRKLKILEDKSDLSFKTAMKADLIIAGSAVSASWIEQYLERTVLGTTQILWWIMENRREYFNRSKTVLNRVRKVIFLSELQSKQWLAWCEEENIKLKSDPALIPLSVNDELAFVAGIPCTLNTPSFSAENMLKKREILRSSVRKEMGLKDNDMLVISLSSINPGKGQFLLLESARLIFENGQPLTKFGVHEIIEKGQDYQSRALMSESKEKRVKKLKILIGSVGGKSNKVVYVKALLNFLSQHSNLSESVLWTPATTRVASLYSAADVYVMNSQGLGETFGRVTIEAMAFGLPVLATEAGGSKEIVENNKTGLLHPLGRPGTKVLAKNLEYMLENPLLRKLMGTQGRNKVQKMYLKKHMYKNFGEVLYSCMRIK